MNDERTNQDAAVNFPAAVDPLGSPAGRALTTGNRQLTTAAQIERLTRQRNVAWRALDVIEEQVESDRPSLRLVAFALAAGHGPEDAEEYNAVVSEEE
jgi:hypothetical protein